MTIESTSGTGSFDLRERKRTRTRLMIQAEALRLFDQKGYAQTTVDEIADRAAISPRTFFRYFPTKEDVVMWDEYDPLVLELLDSRPNDEPVAETLRSVIRETLSGLYESDPERLLVRVRLASTVPELRARFIDEQTHGVELLAPLLARKRGSRVDDLSLQVIGSPLLAAVSAALDRWQESDGKTDLLGLLDQATDALVEGVRELQPSTRSDDASGTSDVGKR